EAGSQRHGVAVAGARMCRSTGEVRAAIPAGGENRGMRAEAVQLALGHVESDDAPTRTLLHDEVDRKVFNEEGRFVTDRLLIEGMQHRVAGAIGRSAGSLRNALAVMRRHAAEGALIDPSGLRPGKRYAVVLELYDGGGSFLAHELDGVLVAQPVRPFDG